MIIAFDLDNWEYEIINNQKYLVRPSDFHIWEIDESNGCYRSYIKMDVIHPNGTRPKAQKHFTFENLTKNYDFFTIEENELEIFEQKHKNVLNGNKNCTA